eukprot:8443431-Pyramimonas_sp.AAC.1
MMLPPAGGARRCYTFAAFTASGGSLGHARQRHLGRGDAQRFAVQGKRPPSGQGGRFSSATTLARRAWYPLLDSPFLIRGRSARVGPRAR